MCIVSLIRSSLLAHWVKPVPHLDGYRSLRRKSKTTPSSIGIASLPHALDVVLAASSDACCSATSGATVINSSAQLVLLIVAVLVVVLVC